MASAAPGVDRVVRLGLVGSPNSGKTTLFNALTGLRARVGNYPGVTVERREGDAKIDGHRLRVIDLPGTYSLSPLSPDEAIVSRVVRGEIADVAPPDGIVITVDACTIERSLSLVAQALALGLPACVVVTMIDELRARGGELNLARLGKALGVPVVGVVGHRGLGLSELRRLLLQPESWSRPPVTPPQGREDRRAWVESVLGASLVKRAGRSATTEAIDRVVLHPILGTALFALVMLFFFQLIFAWATPAMNAIDSIRGAAGDAARAALPAGLLADFVADGVIAGVGAVVVFLPQILLLFSLLYFLEDVGYMARAAFVVDRLMGRVGLEGRAFVALLSSYACAVPGIMATRTIPSATQRLVTMLVAPLMTCSARLPVYALLIGAFVPARKILGPLGLQGLALLGLYALGAFGAFLAAAILGKTLVKADAMPFYLELPPYRMPTAKLVLSQVWGAASRFLRRAGTIILGVSIVLWTLLTFPRVAAPAQLEAAQAKSYALEHSFAGRIGHALEPAIAPLGFDWKIGIGLVASLAAREVIVSTLAQIYAAAGDDETSLRDALAKDRDPDTGAPIYTPATVAALLVFFVFALQCTSTIATLARETNSWRWPAFAFGYLLVLAYAASFIAYRVVGALGA